MNIYIWNKNIDKTCIPNESYFCLSEQLTNFSYYMQAPPNMELFPKRVLNGEYDHIFDFSKDFIDVGACHGVYSIELLKKFNHCYAFEPNKIYYHIIGMNAISNNVLDRLDIYNTFLSSENNITQYNGWVSNIDNNKMLDTSFLTTQCYEALYDTNHIYDYKNIETRTLDSYNFNNIGFIKIDTEGNDFRVLLGALETIKRNNYPPILFEMWPENLDFIIDKEAYRLYCSKLTHFLENLGYEIIYNVNPSNDTHLAVKK